MLKCFYHISGSPEDFGSFAKYPDFKVHVRGLAKLIHEDAGNIQRELKRLEKANFLVTSKKETRLFIKQINNIEILKELQLIVIKSQQMSPNQKVNNFNNLRKLCRRFLRRF